MYNQPAAGNAPATAPPATVREALDSLETTLDGTLKTLAESSARLGAGYQVGVTEDAPSADNVQGRLRRLRSLVGEVSCVSVSILNAL